ncbi:MAG: Sterol-binding domain protein [Clostridia bacterium]|nr:Sterol-binding domain protein [Clostridia bacterium]
MKEEMVIVKIILLMAQATVPYLQRSIAVITKVLKELDIETELINLHELPYFTGKKNKEMDKIVEAIRLGKGVIAVTHVPMLSMHGAMQTFFDSATLYTGENFNKPMMAITYSEWLGEVEAAERMLKSWNIIGGYEGSKVCIHQSMSFENIEYILEKSSEDFYRLMKQDRQNMGSTERQIYNYFREGQSLSAVQHGVVKEEGTMIQAVEKKPEVQVKSFIEVLKQEGKITEPPTVGTTYDSGLSAKEQTIKEITHLLKRQVGEDESFKSLQAGVYTKPSTIYTVQPALKKLQQMPHFFIAQHDKTLEMVLKYNLTHSGEEGYIVIKNGDCEYIEQTDELPVVEFIVTEEALLDILTKKMTYQKAFMLGKLKVKGNFSVLPKIDQIFKAVN